MNEKDFCINEKHIEAGDRNVYKENYSMSGCT